MTYNIAIIGPSDTVSIFRATGADVFPAENGDEALSIIKRLRAETTDPNESGRRYGVVVILEEIMKQIKDEDYTKVSSGGVPAIISVPGISGESGESARKLRKLAERAIGSDILK